MYNDTNHTSTDSDDWIKLMALVDKLILAKKIIVILISIFTILGNTLVLVATWENKSLHQPNKYFIVCLAVADLLVGVFVGPVIVYKLNLDTTSLLAMSVHLCGFITWIDTFTLAASIFSLTFISFDRYIKISKLTKPHNFFKFAPLSVEKHSL
jgi:membrane protein YqaA with SNARE-associated domain